MIGCHACLSRLNGAANHNVKGHHWVGKPGTPASESWLHAMCLALLARTSGRGAISRGGGRVRRPGFIIDTHQPSGWWVFLLVPNFKVLSLDTDAKVWYHIVIVNGGIAMKPSDEKVIKAGVSLYSEDWHFLRTRAELWGVSVSAVIRGLIRRQLCRMVVVDNPCVEAEQEADDV